MSDAKLDVQPESDRATGLELDEEPAIARVTPRSVLPGSFVQIHGTGLGHAYNDVRAFLGDQEIRVIEVTPHKVTVRMPAEPGFDLEGLRLEVLDRGVSYRRSLRPAPEPREGYVGDEGPPLVLAGGGTAGAGLTSSGRGQRILVVFCHPSDKSPTSPGMTAAEERRRQIDSFEHLVNPAFRQMSFNRTDFDFDYTDWLALPETDDFYFWRQSDITAAQNALNALPPNDPNRPAAEAALQAAQDGQALMQETRELFHDGLKRAADAGWTLASYGGIMLCLATDFLRGQATGTWNQVTDNSGHTVNLAANTYLWVIHWDAHWGRRTHEIGHAIASGDLYSATGFIHDGVLWDMMGEHNRMPLFSGHNMVERLGWYKRESDVADPSQANVKALTWSGTTDHNQVYTVRAHDATEDTADNSFHIIRLQVFPGLVYYVEVRQEPAVLPADLDTSSDSRAVLGPAVTAAQANPAQLLFDTHVEFPGAEPAHKGGVIVTKAVDSTNNLNQNYRQITLLSPELMQVGDDVVDAARRIRISVESKVQDRPLTYSVRVQWTDDVTADPNGKVNLRLRPWDSSWQTNDIWVDSEANGWDTYEGALEAGTSNPTGNGDRPWVNHWNRVYASVANTGPVAASDVEVTFYTNSPPAIGDAGTWVPLRVHSIASLPGNDRRRVSADWYPRAGEHTCLRVAVETQLGEIDIGDNTAQENVFMFNTVGSSPHEPIYFPVSVQNPLKEWALVHLRGEGVEPGWELTLEHSWLWLPPRGTKEMRVALVTDRGRWSGEDDGNREDHEIPKEVRVRVTGAVYRDYEEGPNTEMRAEHLEAIGGIHVLAQARRRADLSLQADDDAGHGAVSVRGELRPAFGGVPVVIELTDEDGRSQVHPVETDERGRFTWHSRRAQLELEPGGYVVQAFVQAHELVADTESPPVHVELEG
ncbi:hypothetical protein SAMN05660642_04630 [Geodermatophilus siccatus]|uniref:IPT/TIG domain-containing protein n=1 Tax=Geodermatophilus siccatus TaxID=1137991 RepID=A0A1H0ANG2_9ACTN|nr:IPT/TIG domain-containing protein [Geodermatophilus siccatus]SDN34929.1 hypothetical protein SAMN05660642_04630 [Geodermatophilus siccatus]